MEFYAGEYGTFHCYIFGVLGLSGGCDGLGCVEKGLSVASAGRCPNSAQAGLVATSLILETQLSRDMAGRGREGGRSWLGGETTT